MECGLRNAEWEEGSTVRRCGSSRCGERERLPLNVRKDAANEERETLNTGENGSRVRVVGGSRSGQWQADAYA